MLQFYIRTLCALMFVVSASLAQASAPKRIALLIGNQGYADDVGPLATPHNNVMAIAASLGKLGFDVQVLKDGSYRNMDIAIRRYVTRVRKAGDNAIVFSITPATALPIRTPSRIFWCPSM